MSSEFVSASGSPCSPTVVIEDDRTSIAPEGIRRAFLDHLHFTIGKEDRRATPHDRFSALALVARDRMMAQWSKTQARYLAQDTKRIYYLSA